MCLADLNKVQMFFCNSQQSVFVPDVSVTSRCPGLYCGRLLVNGSVEGECGVSPPLRFHAGVRLQAGPPDRVFLWAGLSSRGTGQSGEGVRALRRIPRALRLAVPGLHGHAAAGSALVLHRAILREEEVQTRSGAFPFSLGAGL